MDKLNAKRIVLALTVLVCNLSWAAPEVFEVNKKWFGNEPLKERASNIALYIAKHKVKEKTRQCFTDENKKCYVTKGRKNIDDLLVPPYMSMLSGGLTSSNFSRLSMLLQKPPDVFNEEFLPIELIVHGESQWRRWEKAAESGEIWMRIPDDDERDEIFAQEYDVGIKFMKSVVKGRADLSDTISVCYVEHDNNGYLFNGLCVPIATISDGKKYILADWTSSGVGGNITDPDFSFSVDYTENVPAEVIRKQIQDVLEQKPWSLMVRNRRDSVVGGAKKRVSPIISPWAEDGTVNVTFEEAETITDVQASAQFAVNFGRAGDPISWREPGTAQLGAYVRQLRISLKQAFDQACGRSTWIDSTRLRCGR